MIPPGPGARSIEPDDHRTVPTPDGSRAHEAHVAHSARLERRLYAVGDDAWCLVGNGLSNQTFVRGPEGIIAIDTGESIEEMRAAITELRTVCTDPIVAVCYTHFHYVAGTRAVLEAVDDADALPIWGHAAVDANRRRAAGEIAPTYLRGIVEQFAVTLPPDGEDGIVNVGLGLSWHRAEHAPFTPGYLPPTHTFDGPTRLRLAGLDVDVTPAPSDADDSVTLWFPALGLAVHNLVWPALFNVFAIRGEEYRDPRVLVRGIDHLRSLDAEHLIATHGPPLSGAAANADRITRVRDAIQFLWDQTVRWTNRGATSTELADLVVLPTEYDDDYLTAQLYGIVEHHTRQIRSGLFGFFDGDPQQLLPHAPRDRSARMIEAMGGADAVRARARAALDDDLRWALELAGILSAADDATDEDRALLATALRTVARRTSAANIRNWCLTRARELDGTASLDRFRTHRLARAQVLAAPLAETLPVLRVLVDPDRLGGIDLHLAVEIAGDRSGLHFRNSIACPTDGVGAGVTLHTDRETWADVLSGRVQLTDARTDGRITFTGDGDAAVRALAAVELPGLR